MSVGNSGNGAVVISTGCGQSLSMSMVIELSVCSILAPVFLSFSITLMSLFGSIPSIVILPLVTAAATRYVPASILSAGISKVVPIRFSTPLIIILSLPAP